MVKKWYNLIRHPVYEWLHTSHRMFPYDKYWVVEHYFFGKLVTIDIVEADELGKYKGKNEYSNRRFRHLFRTADLNEAGKKLEELLNSK
jgi:hypothetical protein